jgi:UDP-N-acetylmuramoyl-tripeptide--D-alanyl-D-alanine ligase
VLPFTLNDVAHWCGGELIGADPTVVPTGVSTDTRQLRPGDLFFALSGPRFDGHQFVEQALGGGATCAVVRLDWARAHPGVPLIAVDDTLRALGAAAAGYRGLFFGPVVCVTGSSGKTTTKEMLARTLSPLGPVVSTPANFNNEVGVPLTLFGIREGHQAAVVELAMRGPGQIGYLAQLARPRVGVITTVDVAHLELLGSRRAIAEAKSELLQALPADGVAVLPRGSDWYGLMTERCRCRVVSFGACEHATVRVVGYRADGDGCRFAVMAGDEVAVVELGVAGEHFAVDAAAAVGAALALNVPLAAAAEALRGFSPPEMRGARTVAPGGYTVLNDAYNANPESMAAALRALEATGGRKAALLGDMLELGDEWRAMHRAVGAIAHQCGIELLATVGDGGWEIAAGALAAGMSSNCVRACGDVGDAVGWLRSALRQGDVVLVKASRGMRLERAVEALLASDGGDELIGEGEPT